jgi:hypothetical protein
MKSGKKYMNIYLVGIAIFMSFGLRDMEQERPTTGYWAMEGNLLTHQFIDEADTLSGNEIYELQDEKGLTIWFGRYIFKDVCVTGLCRMIRLWLFWDGAGNHLDIQLFDDEPLTKSDHTEFEPDDYKKLYGILLDQNSILKGLTSEDLTIETEPDNPFEVDGYSSATQPAVAEVVVKDAVFTCHTLWHTVFGSTRTKILDMLDERISHEYLSLMFDSQKHALISWAIQTIERLPEYHEDYFPLILEYIKSDNELLSDQALAYFQPQKLQDDALQKQLAAIIPQLTPQKKNEVVWKFVDYGNACDEVVLALLEMFRNGDLGVGALNLVYRLVRQEQLIDKGQIFQLVENLSSHENAYVRNLTTRLLEKTP